VDVDSLNMSTNNITSKHTSEELDTSLAHKYKGWTLDKPECFLVHQPSRIDSLGGNLVKYLVEIPLLMEVEIITLTKYDYSIYKYCSVI